MKINEILESVKSGKISTVTAKKLLTLYSIEEEKILQKLISIEVKEEEFQK